jgi:hypothetical protein
VGSLWLLGNREVAAFNPMLSRGFGGLAHQLKQEFRSRVVREPFAGKAERPRLNQQPVSEGLLRNGRPIDLDLVLNQGSCGGPTCQAKMKKWLMFVWVRRFIFLSTTTTECILNDGRFSTPPA